MKMFTPVAIAAAIALLPLATQAQAGKKLHGAHRAAQHDRAVRAMPAPAPYGIEAYGNNANSMSGDNSAANNANGRTSGGSGHN